MVENLDIFSVNVYQCTDSDHPDIQAIQVKNSKDRLNIEPWGGRYLLKIFSIDEEEEERFNSLSNIISILYDSTTISFNKNYLQ